MLLAQDRHSGAGSISLSGIFRLSLSGIQFFLLEILSSGKYGALDLKQTYDLGFLAWFPSALKAATVALICTALFVLSRNGWQAARTAFMCYRPPALVCILNLVLFLILAGWLAWTPPLRDLVLSTPDWRLVLFQISPVVWITFGAVNALHLVSPKAAARAITMRHMALFVVLFGLMIAYFYSALTLGKAQTDALIMLTMSIATPIYALTGGTVSFRGYDANGMHLFATDTFTISMAPSCAGTQGMTLATLAALLFIMLEYKHLRLRRVLLLVPVLAGLAFLVDAVRIAVLLYIGEHWSPEVAVNGFHSNFGVVSLAVVSILFVAVVQSVPMFRQTQPASGTVGDGIFDTAASRFLAPLAVLIGVSLVTGLFSGSFYWLYPVHAAAGAIALYWARDTFRHEFNDVSGLAAAVGVIIFIVWVMMVPHDNEASTAFAEALYAAPVWLVAIWFVCRILGSVVVVPLAEELAFRGFLQEFLAKVVAPYVSARVAGTLAILVAGIAFALVHASFAAALVAGIAYGFVYSHRSRLGDAVLAHAVTNFLIAVYVLMLGRWSYW